MPTVAQDLQERARQALQARAMQQAQEMQRKNGQPNMVPPGTPRPPMQAQGIDTLQANVGEGYAHGGIIGNVAHFDGTSSSFVKDLASLKDKIVGAFTETDEDKAARLLQQRLQQEGAPIGYFTKGSEDYDKKSALRSFVINNPTVVKNPEFQANPLAFMEKSKNVNTAGDVNIGNKPYVPNERADAMETNKLLSLSGTPSAPAVSPTNVSAPKPPATQTQTRVNAVAPAQPSVVNAPAPAQTEAYKKLTEMMNQDPEAKANALRDRYMKEVGSRDLSIYDQMAEELKARKERLNAPKAGYDAMMEYLEQVALGGGRSSAESGSLGASRQRQLQLSRQGQQNELMDKILDLGAKKSDAQFAEKKGMFEMTQTERENIFKKAFDAAKSVNASDDEAKKIAAQAVEKELDRKNQIRAAQIGAQDRDQLMNRARALMAVDKTLGLEEAMKRAALAAGATSVMSTESKDKAKGLEELRKLGTEIPVAVRSGNSAFAKENRRQYEAGVAALEAKYGPLISGINALPSAGGPTSSNVRSQADSIIAGGR
jgi:hypothetical protein